LGGNTLKRKNNPDPFPGMSASAMATFPTHLPVLVFNRFGVVLALQWVISRTTSSLSQAISESLKGEVMYGSDERTYACLRILPVFASMMK
jgi:ribosomal protein S7